MSFGTTWRARTYNTAPLNRRFVFLYWLPDGQGFDDASTRKRQAACLDALRSIPGWDADGRPVET